MNPLSNQPIAAQLNPAEVLPEPITLIVLSFLDRRDVCTCSRLSRIWERLSSDSSLWKPLAAHVGIDEGAENYRVAVGQKLIDALRVVKESDPFLDKEVLTAAQFDAIGYHAPVSDNPDPSQETMEELSKKMGYHDRLNEGLRAHILLHKAGFSNLEPMLERYANVLFQKYGDENGVISVLKMHIQMNRLTAAEELLINFHLSSSATATVLEFFITAMAQEQRLDEAVAICNKFFPRLEKNSKNGLCETLLSYALCYKKHDIVERIIDELLPADKRLSSCIHLIESLIDNKELEKAAEKLKKYQEELECAAEMWQTHPLIPLYVKLGEKDKAWALAMKAKGEDPLILYALRESFLLAGLTDELEKVSAMLPQT